MRIVVLVVGCGGGVAREGGGEDGELISISRSRTRRMTRSRNTTKSQECESVVVHTSSPATINYQ